MQSFAQEPSIRALGIAGGITGVDGRPPKAGTLSEMHCAQWECGKLREILDRVDRPDMHLGLLCTASTMGAIAACMRPGLREAWNTQIGVHIIPEQKIDWTRLMLAKYCEDWGITPWTSCVSVMGGLCRHGPDVAVGLVANLLGQLCYGHGSLANIFVNRMDGSWGDAETQWATSGASRAAERNIRVPIAGVCSAGRADSRREAGLLRAAGMAVSNTANGFTYAWIAGGSGVEARLLGEVMTAAAGMKRGDASDLVKRILEASAESKRQNPDAEPRLQLAEVYDLESVLPKPYFVDELQRTKETLADLGVAFA